MKKGIKIIIWVFVFIALGFLIFVIVNNEFFENRSKKIDKQKAECIDNFDSPECIGLEIWGCDFRSQKSSHCHSYKDVKDFLASSKSSVLKLCDLTGKKPTIEEFDQCIIHTHLH